MSNVCYSRDQLLDFTLGKLQETQARQIERHIDACATCEETVAILDDATDSLLRHLREARADGDASADGLDSPEYQRTVDELQQVDILSQENLKREYLPDVDPVVLRDYELLEPLGQGGMGTVYRARHLRLDKLVALKLLPSRRMQDPASVTRFQREMRAIGQLDHPSIVRATDAGEVDGHHFLVMELVGGADLGRLVRQTGPFNQADACELIRQAALGLQHAHETGIVHRDLKPSNLMVSENGSVKILDLGLALLSPGSSGTVDELTTVGQLMGTLDYMAPEQFGDCHAVDQRVDVYSLGATLYKLLSGFAPYSGEQYRTPLQKLKGLATAEVIDIRERVENISDELADIVMRALAREPDHRIASSAELAAFLEAHCAGAELARAWAERSPLLTAPIDEDPLRNSLLPATQARSGVDGLPVQAAPSRGRSRGGLVAWLMAAGGVGTVLLGLMIFLQTNQGTLTIESPRDDLSLQIIRSGKPYKTLTVNKGTKSWSFGLGEYEVRLNETADGLVVENGQFTLKRGQEQLATIKAVANDGENADFVRVADGSPKSQAWRELAVVPSDPNAPTYAGRSFEQWKRDFITERSPNLRGKAVQALLALADGDKQREALDAIFDNVSTRAMEDPFKDETSSERNTISGLLLKYFRNNAHNKTYGLKRFWESAPRHRFQVYNLLATSDAPLTSAAHRDVQDIVKQGLRDDKPALRLHALGAALGLSKSIPSMIDQIRQSAQNDSEDEERAKASLYLVLLGQHAQSTIDFFADLVAGEETSSSVRSTALTGLIWLGPAARSAVGSLTQLLKDTDVGEKESFGLVRSMFAGSSDVNRQFSEVYGPSLPSHATRSPLLANGNWAGSVGSIRDATVAALGCIGPDAKTAVPLLIKELESYRDEQRISWSSLDRLNGTAQTKLNTLVHSLTRIVPDRFPDQETVLTEILGEKRVKVELVRSPKSSWLPDTVFEGVNHRVQELTKAIPIGFDREQIDLSEILTGLDRAVVARIESFQFTGGTNIQVFLAFRRPTAIVQTDESLIPVDQEAVALRKDYYPQRLIEGLPIVDCGSLNDVMPGKQFNETVAGAVAIADRLRSIWSSSRLYSIQLDTENRQDSDLYLLRDKSGSLVFQWGHAWGKERIGELRAAEKSKLLIDYLGELYRNPRNTDDKVEKNLMFRKLLPDSE